MSKSSAGRLPEAMAHKLSSLDGMLALSAIVGYDVSGVVKQRI
jgi:hypothetical protein